MRDWGDGSWMVSGVGVDDVAGGLAFVPSALVGSLPVVVVEVVVEVLAEAADGGVGVGDEGGFPAFFEEGVLDLFDFAVGLGSAGGDEPVLDSELAQGVAEAVVDELVASVGGGLFPGPAPAGEVSGDLVGEGGGVHGGGIVGAGVELGPGE